ncbi:MAG: hypothetical protein U5K31_00615 [Balneolaceae bacterium]|nr:hypothetical protein [Balneolaceae bacterium]
MPRHSSYIKLSQSALLNNLDFIRRKIGSRPVISSVVKANAFGHGISDFVPMAEACGIPLRWPHGQQAKMIEARPPKPIS